MFIKTRKCGKVSADFVVVNSPYIRYIIISAPVPTYLTEQSLFDIIDECETSESYSPLIRTLGEIFSSIENLSKSFPQDRNSSSSTPNIEDSGRFLTFLWPGCLFR